MCCIKFIFNIRKTVVALRVHGLWAHIECAIQVSGLGWEFQVKISSLCWIYVSPYSGNLVWKWVQSDFFFLMCFSAYCV